MSGASSTTPPTSPLSSSLGIWSILKNSFLWREPLSEFIRSAAIMVGLLDQLEKTCREEAVDERGRRV